MEPLSSSKCPNLLALPAFLGSACSSWVQAGVRAWVWEGFLLVHCPSSSGGELQQGTFRGMAICFQHPEKRPDLWTTVCPEVLPEHVDVGKSSSNPALPSPSSPPQGWGLEPAGPGTEAVRELSRNRS